MRDGPLIFRSLTGHEGEHLRSLTEALGRREAAGAAVVRGLPHHIRRLLKYRYVYKMPYAELADVLRISQPAARQRVRRARLYLTTALKSVTRRSNP